MAFTEAASRQEDDILPPVLNNFTNMDVDCHSDTEISLVSDEETESSTTRNSEEITSKFVDKET